MMETKMYKIAKFKEYWAVWLDDKLVCVCVYRKGAEALMEHLAEQECQLSRLRKAIITELGIEYLYAGCAR